MSDFKVLTQEEIQNLSPSARRKYQREYQQYLNQQRVNEIYNTNEDTTAKSLEEEKPTTPKQESVPVIEKEIVKQPTQKIKPVKKEQIRAEKTQNAKALNMAIPSSLKKFLQMQARANESSMVDILKSIINQSGIVDMDEALTIVKSIPEAKVQIRMPIDEETYNHLITNCKKSYLNRTEYVIYAISQFMKTTTT